MRCSALLVSTLVALVAAAPAPSYNKETQQDQYDLGRGESGRGMNSWDEPSRQGDSYLNNLDSQKQNSFVDKANNQRPYEPESSLNNEYNDYDDEDYQDNLGYGNDDLDSEYSPPSKGTSDLYKGNTPKRPSQQRTSEGTLNDENAVDSI